MFNKFRIAVFCLILTSCGTTGVIDSRGGTQDMNMYPEETTLTGDSYDRSLFRVGVLLPLSGKNSKIGKGLKNATLLALDDVKNPKLVLQFYDTKSTPEGARTAIENALNQQVSLVVGPLTKTEVHAVSDNALANNVPVIAFSTAEDVLQPGVYTLGLLVKEQVERIMSFAAQNNRHNFALLLPDNQLGITVSKAALRAAPKTQSQIVRIAFYPPNTSNFAEILKDMTDYQRRQSAMASKKAALKAQAQAGNAQAKKLLAQLKSVDSTDDVDFDAVIIPEYGARLKSAISMFGYYDIYAPKVKFLGTSIWENSPLNKESMIINSWYPKISRYESPYFANKYKSFYGTKPSSLYAFAYDAVALASALSNESLDALQTALLSPEGYMGINGAFRILPDGTNQHRLDIISIQKDGDKIIDEAPKKFDEFDDFSNTESFFGAYQKPLLFGKDEATFMQQVYGYQEN